MTVVELRDLVRLHMRDETLPYLVSNAQINDAICEAEQEAAMRAKLLYTTDTNGVTMVQDQADYALDTAGITNEYFLIDRFVLNTKQKRLAPISLDELDQRVPGWWAADAGVPEYYLTDRLPESVTLYPKPNADIAGDILNFRGFHMPTNAACNDADVFEIPARWHRKLLHWVLYRMYSNPRLDMYDPAMATAELVQFERDFGTRSSAELQQLMARREVMGRDPRFRLQTFGV